MLYVLLPFAFWALTFWADSVGGSLCVIRALTGMDCPSCGATRAAWALTHLDFAGAWQANPVFTAGVYPLALVMIVQDMLVILTRRKRSWIEFLWTGRAG